MTYARKQLPRYCLHTVRISRRGKLENGVVSVLDFSDTLYLSTTDKYTGFTPLLAPASPFWTQWVVFRKVCSNKWLGKLNGQMQGF